MNPKPTSEDVKKNIEKKLLRHFGATPADATREQAYKAAALTVRDILTELRGEHKRAVNSAGVKRVYYMCMEFLIGRSFKNNLCNLGIECEYREALSRLGFDIETLYDCEPDAALGNGGLGRLAACFMDSLSTLGYPATGFSICYEYGLFNQKIIDGIQVELPDVWLPGGDVWLTPRTDKTFRVGFGGQVHESFINGRVEISYTGCEEVEAVPYDMMISGAESNAVSPLRLWKARDTKKFNVGLFTQGQYARALEESNSAEIISKLLYPSDNHAEGKLLRLTQQYFLVCASVQCVIRDHISAYKTLDNLPDKVAIHINDTHPALCIPELMRILVDEYYFTWERAWNYVTRVISYTNHTVLPEALESWREDLFRLKLPRIYAIVKEINERFCRRAWEVYPGDWNKISAISIVGQGEIRMANLSVVAAHSVNGVSKLHSEILCGSVFKDFRRIWPEKFSNVTNGIAHRRWLVYSNPALASLIDECIGPEYHMQPGQLCELADYAGDVALLARLGEIKRQNKERLARYLAARGGKPLDTSAIFDMHLKRMHEYKRQLLNVLNIIGIYADLREDPGRVIQPVTFIFGGKAAPGYFMAKRIIRLIALLGAEIDKNPRVSEQLRVVFVENYNVSSAEILFPAADISEQISLAGKEASGTGCMKLMMNGALTLGTLDGANVEILDAVGNDNMYIFGLTSREVDELWLRGYDSVSYYSANEHLKAVIEYLKRGFCGESFADIASYLIAGSGISDPYMCLADFESYRLTHARMAGDWGDAESWQRMALINIARSGYFAADQSITEYAENIWGLKRASAEERNADQIF